MGHVAAEDVDLALVGVYNNLLVNKKRSCEKGWREGARTLPLVVGAVVVAPVLRGSIVSINSGLIGRGRTDWEMGRGVRDNVLPVLTLADVVVVLAGGELGLLGGQAGLDDVIGAALLAGGHGGAGQEGQREHNDRLHFGWWYRARGRALRAMDLLIVNSAS